MARKTRGAEAPEKTEAQKADEEILKRSRDGLKSRIDAEESERKLMRDDAYFSDIDQWPSEIRKARESDPNGARPCLTNDKLQQYLTQIVNDARRDKPGIKVRPVDDDADVKTARVIQELVRHIEDQSDAQVAYSTAIEWAAKIGLGFLRVTTDYVSPDSFDQEIQIKRVPNPFACYLGEHVSPDGSDAEEGWIFEEFSLAEFKAQFPKAKHTKAAFEDLPEEVGGFWRGEEKVVVCEYFYVEKHPVELLFLADGTTVFADEYDGPADVVEDRRQSFRRSVKWCKHSGVEILEKRDWAGQYIPIIEVVGRESFIEGKRKLWGLVRPAKDALRAYNYWLSTITEKVGLSPKAPFIIADGQIEGYEHVWERANTENRAYLPYKSIDVNGNAVPAPKRQEPSQVEAGMMAMLPLLERNVQTALGMFRASVGEAESQQSGRAILALQRSSDTGTYHFGDNQAISIKHVGRIILDLAPKIIDTKRVIRLTGEDGTVSTAQIDPEQPVSAYEYRDKEGKLASSFNLGMGKYDVTVTVGPSYNTKRQEAAEASVEMLKSQPEILKIAGDLIFKSMDWPMADKFAERFKKLLPPQLQDQDGQDPAMQLAQAKQIIPALQMQLQEVGQELQKAKAGEAPKMAALELDRQRAEAEFAMKREAQAQELELERQKAEAKIALERAVAEAKLQVQGMELEFKQKCALKDEEFKRAEMVKTEEASAMPKVMQALTMITDRFAQALEAQGQKIDVLSQMVAAASAPKQISLVKQGGVTVGAEVRTVQ